MRRTPLIPRPPADHSHEPGYREWHAAISGRCEVCGMRGPLERHHVVAEQVVRREHGAVWDLSNSLELGRYCACHRRHTNAVSRLPRSAVPPSAERFAVELLGEDRAADYLSRYYSGG